MYLDSTRRIALAQQVAQVTYQNLISPFDLILSSVPIDSPTAEFRNLDTSRSLSTVEGPALSVAEGSD